MDILLDTNAFLWLISNPSRLSEQAKTVLQEKSNTFAISIATAWEMAIKSNIGKLTLLEPIERLITQQTAFHNITLLPIEIDIIGIVETLPLVHRDPFDRIIIATAQARNLAILSSDAVFDEYTTVRMW